MFIILTLTVIGLIIIFFKYLLHETVKSHTTLLYQEDFQYYKLQSMIYFFSSIVICTIVFTLLFNFMFSTKEIDDSNSLAIIGRIEASNFNPTAFFFSFFISIIILQYILKQKLKDKLPTFYAFMENQYPIRINSKLLLSLCLFLFGFATIASYKFTVENHILFHQNNLDVIRWYELTESTYSYEEIKEVKYFINDMAPNGDIIPKPHFVLDFTDHSSYDGSKIDVSQTDLKSIKALLAEKKIQIKILRFE